MKYFSFIFLILLKYYSFAQNAIGLPSLTNYSKFDYNGGTQNWKIAQAKNGIIYIANNEGLIAYDGVYWKMYPLPNKTIVRSLCIDKENRIFVGGQDEFGYFKSNENGKLEYTNLTDKIPEKARKFGDIWDIISFNNQIYARSRNIIFKFKDNKINYLWASNEWKYLGILNNNLVAQDQNVGLVTINTGFEIEPSSIIKLSFNDDIVSIIEAPSIKYPIFLTIKSGAFEFNNNQKLLPLPNFDYLKSSNIYKSHIIDNEHIAIATSYNGAFVVDFNGIKKQYFSKEEGLQNNNVLSIFADNKNNLWLGLENGIAFIAFNDAIKLINPKLKNNAAYTTLIKNNYLYIGTSSGLFATAIDSIADLSFCKDQLEMVANTNGQIWSLTDINNQILMGHNEGAFTVKQLTANKTANTYGNWNFVQNKDQSKIYSGNYFGVSILNQQYNTLVQIENILGFEESSRYLTIDDENNIWISHPFRGVFKISNINNQYKIETYTAQQGLPNTLNNHIFKIKNEVVVATMKGVYVYQKNTNHFIVSNYYKNIFDDISLRYLKDDNDGNIWFISEKKLGVASVENNIKKITYFPELNNKLLSGFEFIYPLNLQNVFVSGATGLYHINYQKYTNTISIAPVIISSVSIINKKDSLLFGGHITLLNQSKIPEIKHNWKLLRFQFATPSFGNQSNIEYTYRLLGYENNWSQWSKRTEKEYTNLPAGKYSFEIKARDNLGNETTLTKYLITILPPWYLTILAKIIYAIAFLCALFFIVFWQKKKFKNQKIKFEAEQKKLLYVLELERSVKEKEIIALQNEKLSSEINFQNSELAASAMHLVKKAELITKVKEDLAHIAKEVDNPKVLAQVKKVSKSLITDEKLDQEWDQFSKHFDKVHSDFLNALKFKHPNITSNDLKLCAYIRMNLSTKEIAQLLNISVRGVEISRYRLRKKLALQKEANLFEYLINI